MRSAIVANAVRNASRRPSRTGSGTDQCGDGASNGTPTSCARSQTETTRSGDRSGVVALGHGPPGRDPTLAARTALDRPLGGLGAGAVRRRSAARQRAAANCERAELWVQTKRTRPGFTRRLERGVEPLGAEADVASPMVALGDPPLDQAGASSTSRWWAARLPAAPALRAPGRSGRPGAAHRPSEAVAVAEGGVDAGAVNEVHSHMIVTQYLVSQWRRKLGEPLDIELGSRCSVRR